MAVLTAVAWLYVWRAMRNMTQLGMPRAVVWSVPVAFVLSTTVSEIMLRVTDGMEPRPLRMIRTLALILGIPFITYVWTTRRRR